MARTKRKKKTKNKGLRFLLIIFFLVAAIGGGIGVYISHSIDLPIVYGAYIERYSAENELDANLVLGVIMTESRFNTKAKSKYASGLMQLTDETAAELCKKLGEDYDDIDLHEPKDNIRLGCYYLRQLIDQYKNTDTALAAYNAGPGVVDKWLSDSRYSDDGVTLKYIPYNETREYVVRVNNHKKQFEENGGIESITVKE